MSSSSLHSLLLISDSALPLGSFAFSSGLESFLAHNKHLNSASKLDAFDAFLEQSLENVAGLTLPYVLTAYHVPSQLQDLDNDVDASTPCTVARRASTSQGRALLTIWERALVASAVPSEVAQEVTEFAIKIKTSKPEAFGLRVNGHFAPLFGAVCKALGIGEDDTAYLFLLNHSKAVLSAAVRASVLGPYQSQTILASKKLQTTLKACMERQSTTKVEDATVTMPLMDLWMGRHELLYSRIFNS